MIINKSISEGIVPDLLKIAKIIPVYKKNDAFLPINYRPISLLSTQFYRIKGGGGSGRPPTDNF